MEFLQLTDQNENKKLQEGNGKIFLDYIRRSNVEMSPDVKIGALESNKLTLYSERRIGSESISNTVTVNISKQKVTVIENEVASSHTSHGENSTYYTKKNTKVTEFELGDDTLKITEGEAYQSSREDDFGGADTHMISIKSIDDIKSSRLEIFGHSRSGITERKFDAQNIEDLSKGIYNIELHPKNNAKQKGLHE